MSDTFDWRGLWLWLTRCLWVGHDYAPLEITIGDGEPVRLQECTRCGDAHD